MKSEKQEPNKGWINLIVIIFISSLTGFGYMWASLLMGGDLWLSIFFGMAISSLTATLFFLLFSKLKQGGKTKNGKSI